jgi:hypothetical protein
MKRLIVDSRVPSSPGRCGARIDKCDVADVLGSDEEVDGMRRDAGMSNVGSACSRSS